MPYFAHLHVGLLTAACVTSTQNAKSINYRRFAFQNTENAARTRISFGLAFSFTTMTTEWPQPKWHMYVYIHVHIHVCTRTHTVNWGISAIQKFWWPLPMAKIKRAKHILFHGQLDIFYFVEGSQRQKFNQRNISLAKISWSTIWVCYKQQTTGLLNINIHRALQSRPLSFLRTMSLDYAPKCTQIYQATLQCTWA